MRRPHHADAVGQLKRAGAAGAGDHDHGIAHTHRKMATFAGFPRQILQHRGCDIDHFDLVERAGGKRKQRPADAVTLGIFFLAQIAQRHQRLGEMERGGIVQADELAQIRKPDAFAVPRDLFEDRKGAAERLDAAALPVFGVVVDIALRRLHQPGDRGLAQACRLFAGLWLWCAISQALSLHGTVAELYQADLGNGTAPRSRPAGWIFQHTTI